VAASDDDTWQHRKVTRGRQIWPFGYGWTNVEVTRVTTHRVTRGTLTSSDDVAS
jgi:hypothetical protein